jgi:hypothetical protein
LAGGHRPGAGVVAAAGPETNSGIVQSGTVQPLGATLLEFLGTTAPDAAKGLLIKAL